MGAWNGTGSRKKKKIEKEEKKKVCCFHSCLFKGRELHQHLFIKVSPPIPFIFFVSQGPFTPFLLSQDQSPLLRKTFKGSEGTVAVQHAEEGADVQPSCLSSLIRVDLQGLNA